MAEFIKGHCPKCGVGINAEVINCYQRILPFFEYFEDWVTDTDHGLYEVVDSYRILKCAGCDTVYFQQIRQMNEEAKSIFDGMNSEDNAFLSKEGQVVYYPSPSAREKPKWSENLSFTDARQKALFDDVYGCLNAGLAVPAAVAVRTSLDCATERFGIDTRSSFKEKLEALQENGLVGLAEREVLDALVNAGNAAAHRGWCPSPEDLDAIVSVYEQFIHRVYILQERIEEMKSGIPARPPRKK